MWTEAPISQLAASWSRPSQDNGEYLCWSRMQAEAGQSLEAIVERKERERRIGQGLFFWGVGNAPSALTRALALVGKPVPVVFSVMKSKPKAVDMAPSRTVAWRRYIDSDGAIRMLPAHVMVTSRGDSASGPKKVHYALMCRSGEPLRLEQGEAFDPAAYRNAGGRGAPVGASQVTALLRRVAKPSSAADYEVNLRAWLVGSYWVRLADPVELEPGELDVIERDSSADGAWKESISRIRSRRPHREMSDDLLACLAQ